MLAVVVSNVIVISVIGVGIDINGIISCMVITCIVVVVVGGGGGVVTVIVIICVVVVSYCSL